MTSPPDPTNSTTDPTLQSIWRPVKVLFERTNAAISELYAAHGITTVSPRYSMALIKLVHVGPMTIRELAAQVEVTHSAMSQTVAAMRKDGLVSSAPGADARTKVVDITEAGRRVVPLLEAEWQATEAAVAELEGEVPYPMTKVVADLDAALDRRSFKERIEAHLQLPEQLSGQLPDAAPAATRKPEDRA